MRYRLAFILTLLGTCLSLQAQQFDSVRVVSTTGLSVYRFSPQDTITREAGVDSTELATDTTRWFYDPEGRLQVQATQHRYSSGWRNLRRTEYSYDPQGRLQVQLQSEWNGVYWAPVSRWVYSYTGEDEEAQFESIVYQEPQFNQWYTLQEIGYSTAGNGILTGQFGGTYWSEFYGEQRDTYIPLRINGQTYTFYGHYLKANPEGIVDGLQETQAHGVTHKFLRQGRLYLEHNGVLYDAQGRRVGD